MSIKKLMKLGLFANVHANKINTVQATGTLAGGEAVVLTNHVRMVYSKEIEFKA